MAFTDYTDGCVATGLSATPAMFSLLGGTYAIGVAATFGGGNVTFNTLMPDGSTLLIVQTYTQNGLDVVHLPPGRYQMVITTATAVQFFVTRVPYRAA